jgi:Ser/Thr protein kinase RdoA (MazF antagonist)
MGLDPSPEVLDGFGVSGEVAALPGGEERSFRCGNLVLREENPGDEIEAAWNADLFAGIVEDGFRVPRPVHTRDGSWLATAAEGGHWSAWTYVEGRAATAADAPQMADAIAAFHRAIAGAPYPAHIDRWTSPYRRADLGAFGEMPHNMSPTLRPILDELYGLRRPVTLPEQVIHGDCNETNVRIADGMAPAIIDMATYWRPSEFAVAVGAFWLCAYRGDAATLRHFDHAGPGGVREFDQMLLRACIRSLLVMDGFGYLHELPAYAGAIEVVRRRF